MFRNRNLFVITKIINNQRRNNNVNLKDNLPIILNYIKNQFLKSNNKLDKDKFWDKLKEDKLLLENKIHPLNFEKKLIHEFINLDYQTNSNLLNSFNEYLIRNNIENNKILIPDYGCYLINLDYEKYKKKIDLLFNEFYKSNYFDIGDNFKLKYSNINIENCKKVLNLDKSPSKSFSSKFITVLLKFNLIDELKLYIKTHIKLINLNFLEHFLNLCLKNIIDETQFREIVNLFNSKNINLIDGYNEIFDQIHNVLVHFGYKQNKTYILQQNLTCKLCNVNIPTVSNEEIEELRLYLKKNILSQDKLYLKNTFNALENTVKDQDFDLIIDGLNLLYLSNKFYLYQTNANGIVRKTKDLLSFQKEAEKVYFTTIKSLNLKKKLVLLRNHCSNLSVFNKMRQDGCYVFILPNHLDDDIFILYSALSCKNSIIFSRDQYRKYFSNCEDKIQSCYNRWYQSRLIKLKSHSDCYIDKSCLQIVLTKNNIHLPIKTLKHFFIDIKWYCYSKS